MRKIRATINLHDFYFDANVPDDYEKWDSDVIEQTIKEAFFELIKGQPEKLSIIDIEWDEVKT